MKACAWEANRTIVYIEEAALDINKQASKSYTQVSRSAIVEALRIIRIPPL